MRTMNEERLSRILEYYYKPDLQHLAQIAGVRKSGAKAEIAERIRERMNSQFGAGIMADLLKEAARIEREYSQRRIRFPG